MLAPRLVAFMRRVLALALAVKSRVYVRGAGRIAWRSHQVGEPSVRLALLGGRARKLHRIGTVSPMRGGVRPNISLNPDRSPAALRAVRSRPVSLVR